MKYLILFETEAAYNAAKYNLDLPNVSTIKNKPNWCAFKKIINEIFYTSSDGNIVTPYSTTGFGANIVSNTYENGEGRILFDGNVTSIEYGAFLNCKSLTSINIPDSVTSIGSQAFQGCSSLESVTIGNGVTSIGNAAFERCTSLTSITIPDSVTSIGNNVFQNCTSLTSVTIGNGVTSIGGEAFGYCSNLTSVTIGNGVTSIRDTAFLSCTSLEEFNGKFASTDGRCLIVNGVLKSFAPAGLTEYTISESVTSIGNYVFQYCDSLISITIPDSVTSIGNSAFFYCTSLTSVTIGNGVTSIGKQAFKMCILLTSIYCKPTTPPTLSTSVFDNNASTRKIYVPMESVDAYKAATRWSSYASAIEGYNF